MTVTFTISKSQKLLFVSVLLIVTINILLANSNLYEDNYVYYLWYKNGRFLDWSNDPLFTILFRIFPNNLSYLGWKIYFIIAVTGITWITWVRKSNFFILFAFFTNLVCIDIFFNTTRSTISSFVIFYALTYSRKSYIWLLISIFIHFEFSLIILVLLLISRIPRVLYIFIPFIFYAIMPYFTTYEVNSVEVFRRATAYTSDDFLPQWYLPSLVVLIAYIYSLKRFFNTRILLFSLILISMVTVAIVYGVQYGFRGIPLLLLLVLHKLDKRELLALSLTNCLMMLYLVVF